MSAFSSEVHTGLGYGQTVCGRRRFPEAPPGFQEFKVFMGFQLAFEPAGSSTATLEQWSALRFKGGQQVLQPQSQIPHCSWPFPQTADVPGFELPATVRPRPSPGVPPSKARFRSTVHRPDCALQKFRNRPFQNLQLGLCLRKKQIFFSSFQSPSDGYRMVATRSIRITVYKRMLKFGNPISDRSLMPRQLHQV